MINNKFNLVLCALAASVMTGCGGSDEEKQHYDNRLFISASAFAPEMRIGEEDNVMSREINVGLAKPEGRDIAVTFRAAPELLDTYRLAYYDEGAVLLPAGHCDFSAAHTTVKAGKVAGEPFTLEFTGLDALDLESHYVLPVTVASADIDLLASARTLYFVFREASLVNVVADIDKNWLWPEWKDPAPVADMETFTLEALVYGHAFKNSSSISTIMGVEDRFLVRVGDVLIPKDQIQIAYAVKDEKDETQRGSVTDAGLRLKTGRWYHIAVTFDKGEIKVYLDGVLKASGTTGMDLASVDFSTPHSDESDGKPRCFWIGYSYDTERFLNGMISEARIWNKALTAEEINSTNHFYKVDPKSDGLVAYWKFDEGSGRTVKDHTSYGNDLSSNGDVKWFPLSLPEKK